MLNSCFLSRVRTARGQLCSTSRNDAVPRFSLVVLVCRVPWTAALEKLRSKWRKAKVTGWDARRLGPVVNSGAQMKVVPDCGGQDEVCARMTRRCGGIVEQTATKTESTDTSTERTSAKRGGYLAEEESTTCGRQDNYHDRMGEEETRISYVVHPVSAGNCENHAGHKMLFKRVRRHGFRDMTGAPLDACIVVPRQTSKPSSNPSHVVPTMPITARQQVHHRCGAWASKRPPYSYRAAWIDLHAT